MLVLSRKNKESVVVGGTNSFEHLLKVTVVEIRGKEVKLGFDVNRDIPVHCEEVWELICGGEPHPGSGSSCCVTRNWKQSTRIARRDRSRVHEQEAIDIKRDGIPKQ